MNRGIKFAKRMKRRLRTSQQRLGRKLIVSMVFLGSLAFVIVLLSQLLLMIPSGVGMQRMKQLGDLSRGVDDLKIALIDEETGQRGYDLTLNPVFLQPYASGRRQFQQYALSIQSLTKQDSQMRQLVNAVIASGHLWESKFGAPQVALRKAGKRISVSSLLQGKAQLDAFRKQTGLLMSAIFNREQQAMDRNQMFTIVALLVNACVAGLTLFFAARLLVRQMRAWLSPIERLIDRVGEYGQGDLSHHVPELVDKTELGELFAGIEYMRIALQQRILEVEEQALRDGLTGIWNRRQFDRALATAIESMQDGGAGFTLLLCDIDHFKWFNDEFGHLTGDAILKQVAKSIDDFSRPQDLVARYGGEEFAVIVKQTDRKEAARIAERLCAQIASLRISTGQILSSTEQAMPTVSQTVRLTISVGVGVATPSDTVKSLIARTDQALYQAKEHGRNRVEVL